MQIKSIKNTWLITKADIFHYNLGKWCKVQIFDFINQVLANKYYYKGIIQACEFSLLIRVD